LDVFFGIFCSSMLDHTTAEIHCNLDALLRDQHVAERAKTDIRCAKDCAQTLDSLGKDRTLTHEHSLHNSGMVEDIKGQCAAWITAVQVHDAAWFNINANYKSVMADAVDLKRLALNKVELWRDDPGTLSSLIKKESLHAADHQARGGKQRLLQQAKAAACANTSSPSVVT